MDNVTIKKKLSTYLTEGGYLRNVSDELLYEVLCAWEEWTGTAKEFYKTIGFSYKQMAGLIGKAKKLKREGHFGSDSFKEIHIEGLEEADISSRSSSKASGGGMIELDGGKGMVIRFPNVPTLVDYLKKAS